MSAPASPTEPPEAFRRRLLANASFQVGYADAHLTGTAARGLGVLTCMDSRVDPLRMLGLEPGDAKILRNAGARVTDDVLRTLALASYLLGVERFMIIAHTDCRMAAGNEASVHAAIAAAGGPDTRSMSFLTTDDQRGALCRRRAAGAVVAVPRPRGRRRLPVPPADRAAGAGLLSRPGRAPR